MWDLTSPHVDETAVAEKVFHAENLLRCSRCLELKEAETSTFTLGVALDGEQVQRAKMFEIFFDFFISHAREVGDHQIRYVISIEERSVGVFLNVSVLFGCTHLERCRQLMFIIFTFQCLWFHDVITPCAPPVGRWVDVVAGDT